MMKIALTNLHQYNEGILNFTWLELPATDEEIAKAFDNIQVSHDDVEYYDAFGCPMEESFITDYECDFYEVGEYENIEELNEMAEEYENLADYEKEIVAALIDDGSTFEQAMENYDDCIYYSEDNFTDLARYMCEEFGILDKIPDDLQCYFDFEAYGRDLECNGNFIQTGSAIIEKCF